MLSSICWLIMTCLVLFKPLKSVATGFKTLPPAYEMKINQLGHRAGYISMYQVTYTMNKNYIYFETEFVKTKLYIFVLSLSLFLRLSLYLTQILFFEIVIYIHTHTHIIFQIGMFYSL